MQTSQYESIRLTTSTSNENQIKSSQTDDVNQSRAGEGRIDASAATSWRHPIKDALAANCDGSIRRAVKMSAWTQR